MPGPTTRGTYVGRSKGEGWAAASQKRADAGYDDYPRCRTCGRPMVLGQEISNRGRHYVCTATESDGNA